MIISKLVGGIGRRLGSSRAVHLEGLNSPDEFQDILARERARADRAGNKFSLVAFTFPERDAGAQSTAGLMRVLAGRLRTTDETGWLEGGRIGVLLPNTPAVGAKKVARDVVSSFPRPGAAPSWRVYSYPSQEPPSKFPWEVTPLSGHIPTASGNAAAAHPAEAFFVSRMPAWKRCLDILTASAGLVLLSPLFAAVAVAVKATSRGPVFFEQMRSGRGGKPFVMYKFRSMIDGAERQKRELAELNEQDGPAFKIEHDPRITPLGRLLRMTSVDELPQLWNVLQGDMSLVGPRPLPCDESDACRGWQRRRLDVTPGLTCIWQICDRSGVSFNEWVRMDVRYIRSRSLWRDFKLLLQTGYVVLRGSRW